MPIAENVRSLVGNVQQLAALNGKPKYIDLFIMCQDF
jgi:hypothetical protein